MNLLLDTQALLWWRAGDRRLGPKARAAIAKHAATVYVSAVSAWEVAIKAHTGRLTLRAPLADWFQDVLTDSGFDTLDVRVEHAIGVADLPPHHADPFDRLLIVQSRHEQLTLVTSDTVFDAYGVKLLDARR